LLFKSMLVFLFSLIWIAQHTAAAAANSIQLGTTLVAIPFDQGICVGADTRTSQGTYVSHRYAHKITPVSQHTVICRSGSAAATQHLVLALQQHVLTRALYTSPRCDWDDAVALQQPSLGVREIAHWLQSRVYKMSSSSSSETVSLLVAGFDPIENIPLLYSLFPSGALLPEERFAAAGSGSPFAIGFLDDRLNGISSSKLSEKEAIDLCHQALSLAMNRDGSSGGLCRIMVLTGQGRREFTTLPTAISSTGVPEKKKSSMTGFAASAGRVL
jgi:20S proteasome subunit beta 1